MIYGIIFYFILELLNLIYYYRIKNRILKKNYYYGDRIEKSLIKDFNKKNAIDFLKSFVTVEKKKN